MSEVTNKPLEIIDVDPVESDNTSESATTDADVQPTEGLPSVTPAYDVLDAEDFQAEDDAPESGYQADTENDAAYDDSEAQTDHPLNAERKSGQTLTVVLITLLSLAVLGAAFMVGSHLVTSNTTTQPSNETQATSYQSTAVSNDSATETAPKTANDDSQPAESNTGEQPTSAAANDEAAQEKPAVSTTAEHSHTWDARYKLEHTGEVTHTEVIPTTYKDEYVLETVCNTCQKVVTGKTAEHTQEAGHTAFTPETPVLETLVDVPEHTIEVVDTPASDKYVLSGYVCTDCGEEIDVAKAKELGVYKASDEATN